MATFENMTYVDTTIELDGHEFIRCSISNSILVYRGGPLPVLTGNKIVHSSFKFDDAAIRTLQFLNVLYRSGAANFVDKVVKEMIKAGPTPTSSGTTH